MINFNEKVKKIEIIKKTNPIEIYADLDRKSIVGPLRPIQEKVLSKWFTERKEDKNLIIKLNTGEGKTLIGLLMLQSKINENKSPCIYITPNKYLVDQVYDEAEKFGIPCCKIEEDNEIPQDYLEGKKILIVHIQKVFNGNTIFERDKDYIPKVMLLDDSHACIESIKDTFRITILKNENREVYEKFLYLFKGDLEFQGRGTFLDICNDNTSTIMLVPYWAWDNKAEEVLELLSNYKQSVNSIGLGWNFIKNDLKNYCCYFSNYKIEITPFVMNINKYKFFTEIDQRILMSATTQDDSFFISGLNFTKDEVLTPIINEDQIWSGEKMVIVPYLINKNLDREFIINSLLTQKFSQNFGKVAIVPSNNTAAIYTSLKGVLTNANELKNNITHLKNNPNDSFYILANKYDGIDLPDETCRILVIDSMPFFDNLEDRYEQYVRSSSDTINKQLAQKIEQGLGRGVRGEKDYCAIIIIGNDLVKFITSSKTSNYFSEQTKMQIKIAKDLADFSKEDDYFTEMEPVFSLINQLLSRDEGWKEYYKANMDKITKEKIDTSKYDKLIKEQKYENEFYNENYSKASKLLQDYINSNSFDEIEKSWYLQKLARYRYYEGLKEAYINTQKSAFLLNRDLLRPQCDISYTKIEPITVNRYMRIINKIKTYKSKMDFQLEWDSILTDFTFGTEAHKFENIVNEIGLLLGFQCQQPDKENRVGPDNLWCVSTKHFFIIECKDEVLCGRREIHKDEANQMLSSIEWFSNEYPGDYQTSCFEIIPTNLLAKEASLPNNVRIIKTLSSLSKNLRNYINELLKLDFDSLDIAEIQKLLDIYHLNPDDFSSMYSVNFVTKNEYR